MRKSKRAMISGEHRIVKFLYSSLSVINASYLVWELNKFWRTNENKRRSVHGVCQVAIGDRRPTGDDDNRALAAFRGYWDPCRQY